MRQPETLPYADDRDPAALLAGAAFQNLTGRRKSRRFTVRVYFTTRVRVFYYTFSLYFTTRFCCFYTLTGYGVQVIAIQQRFWPVLRGIPHFQPEEPSRSGISRSPSQHINHTLAIVVRCSVNARIVVRDPNLQPEESSRPCSPLHRVASNLGTLSLQ